jgi:hypothetical protein
MRCFKDVGVLFAIENGEDDWLHHLGRRWPIERCWLRYALNVNSLVGQDQLCDLTHEAPRVCVAHLHSPIFEVQGIETDYVAFKTD